MKNAVIFYSNTNQSKRIAQYFADKLGFAIIDIYDNTYFNFENLILAFPIHNQNLPYPVQKFLKKIKVKNLTLIATYGKMCHGNVLNEIQKKYNHNIVAAAYVPTKHTYINNGEFDMFEKLDTVVQKVLSPSAIKISKSYKNTFANFLKKHRGQIGVKIQVNESCNRCGICTQSCNHNAIINGRINSNCMRCLKCVYVCPQTALTYKLTVPMRVYLKKNRQNELKVFI